MFTVLHGQTEVALLGRKRSDTANTACGKTLTAGIGEPFGRPAGLKSAKVDDWKAFPWKTQSL